MKKKWFFKMIAILLVFGQLFVSPNPGLYLMEIEDNKTDVSIQSVDRGFMGYFYYGDQFDEPAFISLGADGNLKVDQSRDFIEWENKERQIQSARWVGQLLIEKEEDYQFTTKDNDQVMMKISDEWAIKQGETPVIRLEAGLHEVEIEYQTPIFKETIFDLQLSWKGIQEKKAVDPDPLMLPAEFDEDQRSVEFVPEDGLLKRKSSLRSDDHGWLDTDGDGIFDLWEIEGYTVVNGIIRAWDDQLSQQGFRKFISNPNRAHTAHDPYSDLEKASGNVDEGMSWEARHPLVAAVPAISVGMERVILSRLINESGEQGASESRETSSSSSLSNTEGVDLQVGYSLLQGPSVSVTGHYSHTSSQTVEASNSTGKSWSESIGLNRGETAELNANIRYYNTGTGVVYNLEPTFNLVLGRDTLATVRAQLNQQSSHLVPDDAYPARRLNGIALNTLDQFSSRLIPLNYEQVQALDEGEPLRLEMTQFTGQFVKRDASGGNIRSGDWDLYIPQIERTSAAITLDVGDDEAIERWVAAKDLRDPNDRTPELTLGEAIQLAFGTQEGNGGRLYYEHEQTRNKIAIDENAVHLVMDERTQLDVQQQMKDRNLDHVYDVIIRPEMGIHILPALFVADNDDYPQAMVNAQTTINGFKGQGYAMGEAQPVYQSLAAEALKPNRAYILSWNARSDGEMAELEVTLGRNKNSFSLTDQYSRYGMVVYTESELSNSIQLQFEAKNLTQAENIFFDDVSLVELKSPGVDPYHQKWVQLSSSINPDYLVMTSVNDRGDVAIRPNLLMDTQIYKLQYSWAKDAYQIQSIVNDQVLTLTATSGTGGSVSMRDNQGQDDQYWAIEPMSNRNHVLVNYSNKALALHDFDGLHGTIRASQRDGSVNQQFNLRVID